VTMNVNAAHHSVDYLTVTLILLLIFGSPLILIFCACSENKACSLMKRGRAACPLEFPSTDIINNTIIVIFHVVSMLSPSTQQ
jgi:hypothetical protein